MLQTYLLGTYQTAFCTGMMRNENPTPRAALVDSKLSRSSPCLSSPRLASSNTARRQSANAGDGQFEKLVLVKLTAAMAQREMDNSDSNEEREHYRAYMHKSKSSLALFSHCDLERSKALALLRGNFAAVQPNLSNRPQKTNK